MLLQSAIKTLLVSHKSKTGWACFQILYVKSFILVSLQVRKICGYLLLQWRKPTSDTKGLMERLIKTSIIYICTKALRKARRGGRLTCDTGKKHYKRLDLWSSILMEVRDSARAVGCKERKPQCSSIIKLVFNIKTNAKNRFHCSINNIISRSGYHPGQHKLHACSWLSYSLFSKTAAFKDTAKVKYIEMNTQNTS